MDQTVNALERLYSAKNNLEYLLENGKEREMNEGETKGLEVIKEIEKQFVTAMEDDINTANAISALFDLVKYTNTNLSVESSKEIIEKAYEMLMILSEVLGILNKSDEILEDEILEMIEKRNEARKNKDFQLADQIRDELKEKGIILEDTQEGAKWKRIKN